MKTAISNPDSLAAAILLGWFNPFLNAFGKKCSSCRIHRKQDGNKETPETFQPCWQDTIDLLLHLQATLCNTSLLLIITKRTVSIPSTPKGHWRSSTKNVRQSNTSRWCWDGSELGEFNWFHTSTYMHLYIFLLVAKRGNIVVQLLFSTVDNWNKGGVLG